MEDVKFIRQITDHIKGMERQIYGNCAYYALEKDGNRAKLYCESGGVQAAIISKTAGPVDSVFFPFANYFDKVSCSKGAPEWYQHIDGNRWYFEEYPHVLPKDKDYDRLAAGLQQYMQLFFT